VCFKVSFTDHEIKFVKMPASKNDLKIYTACLTARFMHVSQVQKRFVFHV